jgi:hypothetical protein
MFRVKIGHQLGKGIIELSRDRAMATSANNVAGVTEGAVSIAV